LSLPSENAELIFDAKAILGEGPVWDPGKQNLFWVDIEGCTLHCHDPVNAKNSRWDFDEMIGAAVPAEDGTLLLAMESGLATYHPESNTLRRLQVLENRDPHLRCNDGKCDPNGNFWIGTMDKQCRPHRGNFYRVDAGLKATLQIENTSISNGMAWSPDHLHFYYIDTPNYEVVAYDFDRLTSDISNKRSLFKIPESCGGPDGMTIDREGMLWIAHWGGGCVRRWDPASGRILQEIKVDAPHVTSCCFGGMDLNMLYITTASSGLDGEGLRTAPTSGGLFCIETRVAGFPVTYFKGK